MRTDRASLFLRQTFAALSFRDFRVLMIGNGISNVGSWMQLVAQPWIVLNLTGSAFWVGVDAFAGHLPTFLLVLFGGVVADRHSRRRIMAISQVVQLLAAAGTALLLVTGHLHVWMVIAASLISGTAQAFSFPAYQALVTTLTPTEHLSNAISLNSLQFNLTRVIGPILAGVAMSTVGAAWCFWLNALSFVPLLVALYQLRSAEALSSASRGATVSSGSSLSFGFMKGSTAALAMLALVAISTAFCGPLSGFLPVLVRKELGGDAAAFSHGVSVFGLGALVGALWAASRARALSARFALGSSLALSVLVALSARASGLALLYVLLFFAGLFMVAASAAANTVLQSSFASEFRGRIASLFLLAIRGGLALGNLTTGYASDHFGVRTALLANGGLAFLLTVAVARAGLRAETR
jgi:MFS family permease